MSKLSSRRAQQQGSKLVSPKSGEAVAQPSGRPEFGVASQLPALSVCRLEAREDVLRKLRRHVDDPALSDFTCPICLDPFWQPVRTVCGHAFCEACLLKAVLTQLSQQTPDISCPLCRTHLHVDDVAADQALLTKMRQALSERDEDAAMERTGSRRAGRLCRGLTATPSVGVGPMGGTPGARSSSSASSGGAAALALPQRPATMTPNLAGLAVTAGPAAYLGAGRPPRTAPGGRGGGLFAGGDDFAGGMPSVWDRAATSMSMTATSSAGPRGAPASMLAVAAEGRPSTTSGVPPSRNATPAARRRATAGAATAQAAAAAATARSASATSGVEGAETLGIARPSTVAGLAAAAPAASDAVAWESFTLAEAGAPARPRAAARRCGWGPGDARGAGGGCSLRTMARLRVGSQGPGGGAQTHRGARAARPAAAFCSEAASEPDAASAEAAPVIGSGAPSAFAPLPLIAAGAARPGSALDLPPSPSTGRRAATARGGGGAAETVAQAWGDPWPGGQAAQDGDVPAEDPPGRAPPEDPCLEGTWAASPRRGGAGDAPAVVPRRGHASARMRSLLGGAAHALPAAAAGARKAGRAGAVGRSRTTRAAR